MATAIVLGTRVLLGWGGAPRLLDHRQGIVDYVVALTPFTGECLRHGCCRQGEDRTDRTEEGRSSERCTEGHGRVQFHCAGGDAWCKEVVLDLLVNNDEPDDDRCLDRRVE